MGPKGRRWKTPGTSSSPRRDNGRALSCNSRQSPARGVLCQKTSAEMRVKERERQRRFCLVQPMTSSLGLRFGLGARGSRPKSVQILTVGGLTDNITGYEATKKVTGRTPWRVGVDKILGLNRERAKFSLDAGRVLIAFLSRVGPLQDSYPVDCQVLLASLVLPDCRPSLGS